MSAFLEQRRRRWMRPDAKLWLREDHARFMPPYTKHVRGDRRFDPLAALEEKYSPTQPRVPAGNPDGGQWTVVSSGGGISISVPSVAIGETGGEGDEGGLFDFGFGADLGLDGLPQLAGDLPSGDLEPKIPDKRPSTTQALNRAARVAARRFPIVELAIQAYPYLAERTAELYSYFDPAKTLEELVEGGQTPALGYDRHHIVERATATKDGSENARIDAPDNIVRIPRWKHWDLNRWYETEKAEYGRQTPREYLKGKNWEERYRVGLDGLREVGVLK